MTAVAPWGENAEDAYDQGLVELGLGDSRLIEMKGAMYHSALVQHLHNHFRWALWWNATLPQPMLGMVHQLVLEWLGLHA